MIHPAERIIIEPNINKTIKNKLSFNSFIELQAAKTPQMHGSIKSKKPIG